jgi:hypothetical protein
MPVMSCINFADKSLDLRKLNVKTHLESGIRSDQALKLPFYKIKLSHQIDLCINFIKLPNILLRWQF